MNQQKNPVYLPYLLITILSLLLYLKTLFFGVTYFDDDLWVGNPNHGFKNMTEFFDIFLSPILGGSFYRPMITLSFILDSALSDVSQYSFRITNIFLHIINSCLVFVMFKKLHYKHQTALGFALMFTVHPLLVQAVAWLPGRTESLLCIFTLAALINFLTFFDTKHRRNLYYHFLFFFLALLTKETALILPVICLAYILLIGPKVKFSDMWKIFVPWVLVVLVWIILRQVALAGIQGLYSNMISAFFANFPAVFLYFGKSLFPINLSVLPILADSNLWIGVVMVFMMAGLLAISRNRRKGYVLFGLCWFLFFLFPAFVHGFVFPEYRGYISMIGVFIILHESIFTEIIEKSFSRNLILTGTLVILLFAAASRTADQYKSRLSFWQNAVLNSPGAPSAHVNMAYTYYDMGELDKAKAEFEQALVLIPQAPTINYNLGVIYYNQGNFGLAEQSLKKELINNPSNIQALEFLESFKR